MKEYFELLSEKFEFANKMAIEARSKGYDPETNVEIKAAPDLASRVEGIIGIDGLAEIIKRMADGKSRPELAFEVVKEICTNPRFEMEQTKRLLLAVRVGLSILTEGILVAPTEGVQGVELHKNSDGSDYISVIYAGPIRGAGGTSAALSVALADYARKMMGIGNYKATQSEVQRYIEEMLLYHSRVARLQYLPTEEEMKAIIMNCPVCVDGLPTEEIEVSIHRNLKRLDAKGVEQIVTNRVRSGIGLVICEGIAQKAKSVIKNTKNAGLDWSWLNSVIKVDKGQPTHAQMKDDNKNAVFLQELVAGRPVLAYPEYPGAFRLRYGRSRLTGIAAKGFSPATMIILNDFIVTGTQVKVEKPGKGCIATPIDSIEGPFVKLGSGEAFRVNTAEQAKVVADQVVKVLSVGDILITYGDFKKTNTPLPQTSYVEEYWSAQLKQNGYSGEIRNELSFQEAYNLSKEYNVPMHPRYIYDYFDVPSEDLLSLGKAVLDSDVEKGGDGLFDIIGIEIDAKEHKTARETLERICIPHFDKGDTILVRDNDAQSLIASLGFAKDGKLVLDSTIIENYDAKKESLEMLNSITQFKIMKRATRIGARIGRPEKAKERLMKPSPNVLFPIGEYGGKERNLYKSYAEDKRKFGNQLMEIEVARYKCTAGQEFITSPYCTTHKSRAGLERVCISCGRVNKTDVCKVCGSKTVASGERSVNISSIVDNALANLELHGIPKVLKGVKGLVSKDKIAEPLEKGILRSVHSVYIFKDGTSRFDATDAPMTHFYPKEVATGIEKLKEMGYTHDYLGNPLVSDDQLLEMRHQDVILNRRGGEYLFRVSQFMDDLLVKYYKMKSFYNATTADDLIGQCVITLSPHTSCGVLGRIIGFTNANVGFAHPYTISARRRNCDGDEDTTMLLLDGLINFSRDYLPVTIGGTMDAPLILTIHILPEEVDDEVHAMEVVSEYGLAFYDKTFTPSPPGDFSVELVGSRLKKKEIYSNIGFTHMSGANAITDAPVKSIYTKLKTMQEKIDLQFKLMDRLCTVDKQDTARRLIISHFIPDLIGNLHKFSRQTFRCVACNSKYRRVPLIGKCKRCKGKIVLTISKGGIEKYLNIATNLADRYNLEPYIRQRLYLIRDEIGTIFGGVGGGEIPTKQFNLSNFM